ILVQYNRMMIMYLVQSSFLCVKFLRFVGMMSFVQKFVWQFKNDAIMVKLLTLLEKQLGMLLRQAENHCFVSNEVSMNGLLKKKDWSIPARMMIKKILIQAKSKIQFKDDEKEGLRLNDLRAVSNHHKPKAKNLLAKTSVVNVEISDIMRQLVRSRLLFTDQIMVSRF